MHAWEQIQKTVDYIEEHLSEEIKIEGLAKLAALSQFYYQRLFRRLVKKSVNEYIRLRRLAQASIALRDSERNIVDIALEYGFSCHETFTRAFKETFGMTPYTYRRNPVALNNFGKPQLLLNYTLVAENVPLIADDIVLEITKRTLSSPQYFNGMTVEEPISQMPGGGEGGVDSLAKLWHVFHEQKSMIQGLKRNGDELGVTCAGVRAGYYRYFVGAQALSDQPFEGFRVWELPAGTYIVCSFEAEDFEYLTMNALHKAHKYLFETWLPHQNVHVKPFLVERYSSHTPDTTTMELWVLPEDRK